MGVRYCNIWNVAEDTFHDGRFRERFLRLAVDRLRHQRCATGRSKSLLLGITTALFGVVVLFLQIDLNAVGVDLAFYDVDERMRILGHVGYGHASDNGLNDLVVEGRLLVVRSTLYNLSFDGIPQAARLAVFFESFGQFVDLISHRRRSVQVALDPKTFRTQLDLRRLTDNSGWGVLGLVVPVNHSGVLQRLDVKPRGIEVFAIGVLIHGRGNTADTHNGFTRFVGGLLDAPDRAPEIEFIVLKHVLR